MFQTLYKRGFLIVASTLILTILAACSPAQASTQAVPVSTSTNTSASTALPETGSSSTQAAVVTARLNLNTASAQDFLTIPNLGSRMVKEFQEYRLYTSILQFRKEIGKYVDANQVAEYEKYVYVPISVNDSDATTLQQIAGLDATEAEAIIAGRPYASNDAFLTKLAQVVTEDQLAIAKTYLSSQ